MPSNNLYSVVTCSTVHIKNSSGPGVIYSLIKITSLFLKAGKDEDCGSVPPASGPSPNNASEERDNSFNSTGDADAVAWRVRRSAETWSGFRGEGVEDGSVSDQEEFELTSSTFALAGDTAHNQAMVHWSGQNSSVILMLTKYYDFNSGRVTESSLWRSTDYGTTYEKLNEKVGTKSILSYLYVSPNNKRKIMLLTDPEVESSLLISLDEGASYQKHSLGFDILSLLFHPEQEDWILAYSHDQKLYVSVEFGKRWQLVGLFFVFLAFLAIFSPLPTGSQYITCKLQNCSDGNKGKPFPGFIIPNSLVVQDEYVFIQVVSGQAVHYVSYKRHAFYPMKLPKYTLPKVIAVAPIHLLCSYLNKKNDSNLTATRKLFW
uniref:Sortilin N-terminal domain-containing protein n=1 Tax=Poecilia reticulata TaxID=8081 RepID=A0A3P9P8Y6_POERE